LSGQLFELRAISTDLVDLPVGPRIQELELGLQGIDLRDHHPAGFERVELVTKLQALGVDLIECAVDLLPNIDDGNLGVDLRESLLDRTGLNREVAGRDVFGGLGCLDVRLWRSVLGARRRRACEAGAQPNCQRRHSEPGAIRTLNHPFAL